MLTRIEIDGFKTFDRFVLDLRPFSAVVGPNASGKSNLFDALRFLSLLAQFDVRTAMQGLRGEPEELFRRTAATSSDQIRFAVEVLLNPHGIDAFGTKYSIKSQRVRYELELSLKRNNHDAASGVFVSRESCTALNKKDEKLDYLRNSEISYSGRKNPFLGMREGELGRITAFEIRQDGPASETGASKRGRPIILPADEASRTALSTITTAEFPHLYALRDVFSSTRFLEINPQAARRANDRFEDKRLRADASNLAAVLSRLREETSSKDRRDGAISDISADLASLIPSVRSVEVFNDPQAREYSFGIATADRLRFSARVISDGTLRILALLAILDDPDRHGILCFEEPENGVHEGRISSLIGLLRDAVAHDELIGSDRLFQVLINTHSPAVMQALEDDEIIAADLVSIVDPELKRSATKTRMRVGFRSDILNLNPETDLNRVEVETLLRKSGGMG